MSRDPKSTAVMARRDIDKSGLDDFPTPPWATRALMRVEEIHGVVYEPAVNRGYIANTLLENPDIKKVYGTDIHDYGTEWTKNTCDFLTDPFLPHFYARQSDWIITNPPFKLCDEFILKSLKHYVPSIAMFVRTQFVEGKSRYEKLFNKQPPTRIYQFVERVGLTGGKVDPNVSSATAYCWMVWHSCMFLKNNTTFHWIPPCKSELERESDYLQFVPQSQD